MKTVWLVLEGTELYGVAFDVVRGVFSTKQKAVAFRLAQKDEGHSVWWSIEEKEVDAE